MKNVYLHIKNPDKQTMEQFNNCVKEPYVKSAALMPDAHSGYVAPIGSVIATKDFIVPAWVGFDIGCGMIAVRLQAKNLLAKIIKNKSRILSQVQKEVPMGKGESNSGKKISPEITKKLEDLILEFQKNSQNKDVLNLIKGKSPKFLGTLGGGNHFIELCSYKDEVWLVVHSGSRGLGHTIATMFMKKASKDSENYERTFPISLDSTDGKDYISALNFCLDYALLNRLEISSRVCHAIENITGEKVKSTLWVNKNHNHAIFEHSLWFHRKGATPSNKKERGVIPANSRDGSFLVLGKGNPKFLYSSSHGAGRRLSRTEARKQITIEQLRKDMSLVASNLTERMIDESPSAYKDIFEVMELQKESVKIIKRLLPIINWKGN